MRKLAESLETFHRNRIVHGHLNPHQIIADAQSWRLRDLHGCYVLPKNADDPPPPMRERHSRSGYAAPELLLSANASAAPTPDVKHDVCRLGWWFCS